MLFLYFDVYWSAKPLTYVYNNMIKRAIWPPTLPPTCNPRLTSRISYWYNNNNRYLLPPYNIIEYTLQLSMITAQWQISMTVTYYFVFVLRGPSVRCSLLWLSLDRNKVRRSRTLFRSIIHWFLWYENIIFFIYLFL